MIPDLNIFARTTRSLTVVDRGFDVEDDFEAPSFMAALEVPTTARITDGSPREGSTYILRWRSGLLGPQNIPQAGWRISLTRPTSRRTYENMVYELLGDPREIRNGANSTGMQAAAMPVGVLYPYTAILKAQDGTTLVEELPVALWSEREDHRDTGTYEEFSGEAPVEHGGAIKQNTKLDIGGEIYRITSSIIDLEGPRVKFDARRANT